MNPHDISSDQNMFSNFAAVLTLMYARILTERHEISFFPCCRSKTRLEICTPGIKLCWWMGCFLENEALNKIYIANSCMRKNYQTADKNVYLGIQREVIEYHGTYKCNLGCLRIHYFVPSIHPQSSQLRQDIYYLKKEKIAIDYARVHRRNLTREKSRNCIYLSILSYFVAWVMNSRMSC